MFGISFSELMLVGLVALLVLGPERLPGAARTAGLWVGRLKRSFNAIKQEVERELGADEIRRQLHNEHILQMERDAKKLLAPLTGEQMVDEPTPSATPAAPAAPAEPPTVAAHSRLANLPGVKVAEAPASTVEPPVAAPQTPPTSETPRNP